MIISFKIRSGNLFHTSKWEFHLDVWNVVRISYVNSCLKYTEVVSDK